MNVLRSGPEAFPSATNALSAARMAEKEHDDLARSSCALVHDKEVEMATIKESLNRLVAIYVSQDNDRESFLAKKEEHLSRKKASKEGVTRYGASVSRATSSR
jgi:phage regulator Rha-like protein